MSNLELHHKDPKAKETHRIWSFSAKRRSAEIEKCSVVCHECHVAYHAEKRRKVKDKMDWSNGLDKAIEKLKRTCS